MAGLVRSSLATWAGLGPARTKKEKTISSKEIISKISDFLKKIYCILINISLYFSTVKIQILY
jgi:hypothetical protein